MRALLCALAFAGPLGAAELVGHGGPVKDIAVSTEFAATASFDTTLGLWTGGEATWLEGHRAGVTAVAILDDGRVASGADDFDVRLWDPETGRAQVLSGHQGKIGGLAAAGELLASASWDGTVWLWPLPGGDPWVLEGHGQAVADVAFSADGLTLFSASADGRILEWDVVEKVLRREVVAHGFGVNTLALGPGWLAYGAVDGGTRVIDLSSGEEIADFTLDRRPILAMARTEGLLAIGDGEGYVTLFDTEAWAIHEDGRVAERGPVWALAFGPEGRTLYAGGISDSVAVYDVEAFAEAEPLLGRGERTFLADPSSMSNGERQFARKCSICHTLGEDGARRAGPPLGGLFGRRMGTVPGYSYSERLAKADLIWDETTINRLFEIGPDHAVPGSKMPMQVIAAPEDRADLIAYLKSATGGEAQ